MKTTMHPLIFALYLASLFFLPPVKSQKLEKTSSIRFKLPENCGFEYNGAQVINLEGQEVVALLYTETGTICFFELKKGEIITCLQLTPEGPDGVGYEVRGFWVENPDEIYLYSYWETTIFKINQKGKVLQRWKLPVDASDFPIIELNASTPLIKIGDEIVMGGSVFSPDGNPIEKPLIFLNIANGKIRTSGHTPVDMQKYYYGLRSLVHYDYAREKGYFIMDFGATDSVYLIRDDVHYAQPAKSNYIREIPALCAIPCKKKIDKETWLKQNANGGYIGVKYDSFNNCYYRFAAAPKDIDSIRSGDFMRNQSILLLDNNLALRHELPLPTGSVCNMALVTSKGLMIPNITPYHNETDNYLFFDIYKVKY